MNRIGLALLTSTLLLVGLALGAAQDVHPKTGERAELPRADKITPQLYATGFETADGLALDSKGNLFVSGYRGNGNIGRISTSPGRSGCPASSITSTSCPGMGRPIEPGRSGTPG